MQTGVRPGAPRIRGELVKLGFDVSGDGAWSMTKKQKSSWKVNVGTVKMNAVSQGICDAFHAAAIPPPAGPLFSPESQAMIASG
jgi:hypothetical protein